MSTNPTEHHPSSQRRSPPPERPENSASTDPLDSQTLMSGAGYPDISSPPQHAPADLVLAGGQGFQKLDRLGKGEFGDVWRARAPGGVEVAVKIILRTLSHEASQRELKALEKIRGLRHPFLLQTHQYQAEQDHLVIVMELADKSLSDRQKECQAEGLPGIPVNELAEYLLQAGEALDYLHSQHVTHRDIKPQNLLMQRGHAKVADFGLARQMEQSVDEASMVCGTPYYMAPEVWSGQLTVQSDQYSLAASWFEMRTGQRLFEANSVYELLSLHVFGELRLDPLPAREQEVLRRALAKDPDQRYPSCLAFAQALKETIGPPPTAPPAPAPALRSRGKFVLAALGCAFTAVVIVLAAVLLRSTPSPTQQQPEDPRPPQVVADWKPPPGWNPVKADDLVEDGKGRHCYRQLVRDVAGERVVMVLVPQTKPTDPSTFYIMENKVWNDLYAIFLKDSKADELFSYYKSRPNCENLVGGDWKEGARVSGQDGDLVNLGVGAGQARVPALRMKVTEAHCFAEWLINGRLPTREQYFKAAGLRELKLPEALNGNPDGLAVDLWRVGPWEVTRGDRDVSPFGCRQMLTNGYEWTRNIADDKLLEIPLSDLNLDHLALYVGHSYLARSPPRREEFEITSCKDCTSVENLYDVGFRVVLER